jgi:predicted lipase
MKINFYTIIEQLKQELELNTVNSIEVYFHSGDSVIARKIDYNIHRHWIKYFNNFFRTL